MISKHSPLVLFFDSWTGGSRHFKRLVKPLEALGYRTLLVHIGSYGHQPNSALQCIDQDLIIRDISFYNKKSILQILQLEQPACVVFLSTRAFAHMACIRFCDRLGIPTFHLFHGILDVVLLSSRKAYKRTLLNTLNTIQRSARKNLFLLLPLYLQALLICKARPSDFFFFLLELYSKTFGITSPSCCKDVRTTYGIVYTPSDVAHMQRYYSIPVDHIEVVGNPDLIDFGHNDLNLNRPPEFPPRPHVLYINTGLSVSGLVFKDDSEYLSHLLQTRDYLDSIGYTFSVKLHPAHFRFGDLPSLLKKHSLEIVSTSQLMPLLHTSTAVFTEPSSLAVLACINRSRLFLVQYGKLCDQLYGKALTEYPYSSFLPDLTSFQTLNRMSITISAVAYKNWLRLYDSPKPYKDMPLRTARYIHDQLSLRAHA